MGGRKPAGTAELTRVRREITNIPSACYPRGRRVAKMAPSAMRAPSVREVESRVTMKAPNNQEGDDE